MSGVGAECGWEREVCVRARALVCRVECLSGHQRRVCVLGPTRGARLDCVCDTHSATEGGVDRRGM